MKTSQSAAEQLVSCYGDPVVSQVRTKLRLKGGPLFAGDEAIIYVSFRFYGRNQLPVSCFGIPGIPGVPGDAGEVRGHGTLGEVSGASEGFVGGLGVGPALRNGPEKPRQVPAAIQPPPSLVLYHNGEPLGAPRATGRLGEFRGRFWAEAGPNEVSVELRGRRVFVETFRAAAGFAPGPGIRVQGAAATATLPGALAALRTPWPGAKGRVRVRLPQGSAAGFRAGEREFFVTIDGDVEIRGTGTQIIISRGGCGFGSGSSLNGPSEPLRAFDVHGQDITVCFRLRKDRKCVILEVEGLKIAKPRAEKWHFQRCKESKPWNPGQTARLCVPDFWAQI